MEKSFEFRNQLVYSLVSSLVFAQDYISIPLTHDDFDIISGAKVSVSMMIPPLILFIVFLELVIFTLLLNLSAQICVPDNGRLLGENGEFNHEQFQMMMKGKIMRYFRRQLKKAVSLSESEVRLNLVGSLSLQMS
jgi:hypothetical protein